MANVQFGTTYQDNNKKPIGDTSVISAGIYGQEMCIRDRFPGAKLAIGPAIEDGFYYDFDVPSPFTPEDLEKLEAEMAAIAKQDLPIERFSLPVEEAKKLMADQPYKLELIRCV